jgi:hypothetical protein
MLGEMKSYEVEEWKEYYNEKARVAEMERLKQKVGQGIGKDDVFGGN